jgi:hypothetical protein
MSSDGEAEDGPLASFGLQMPFEELWKEGVG